MRAHPETGEPAVVLLPSPERSPIPNAWNFSRLVHLVEEAQTETGCATAMIEALRGRLMDVLPDFAEHLGYDGKPIESHSTGWKNRETGQTSDPDADWGKHETRGVDKQTGKGWTQVKTWFGYGLHLIADTQHEIPVAFEVTRASAPESVELSTALKQLFADDRELAGRCADFSADKGLDGTGLRLRPASRPARWWGSGKLSRSCRAPPGRLSLEGRPNGPISEGKAPRDGRSIRFAPSPGRRPSPELRWPVSSNNATAGQRQKNQNCPDHF